MITCGLGRMLTLDDHLNRISGLGIAVLINETWYKRDPGKVAAHPPEYESHHVSAPGGKPFITSQCFPDRLQGRG
jgi:hypothetical protein